MHQRRYELFTFRMIHSDALQDEDGVGPAKIKEIEPKLRPRVLRRIGNGWYAAEPGAASSSLPEELPASGRLLEGAKKSISVNAYERSSAARAACLAHYGYACAVCDRELRSVYGEVAEKLIHVHHVVPISEVTEEYECDPIRDLRPVCPNCHAVIHCANPPLSIEAVRDLITENAGG